MRISRTTRSCTLHLKVYETYHVGAAIGDGWYSHRRCHRCQPKPRRGKAPRRFSLRLDIESSSQVLQIARCLYHLTLPPILTKTSCAARFLRSTGVTQLHHYYEPRRHRLIFGRLPGVAGYTTYLAPPISRWDEDGFSSCLACPCHRAVPTTPPK